MHVPITAPIPTKLGRYGCIASWCLQERGAARGAPHTSAHYGAPPPGKYGLRTQFKEWEQLDIEEKPTLTGLSFQVRRALMSPDEP